MLLAQSYCLYTLTICTVFLSEEFESAPPECILLYRDDAVSISDNPVVLQRNINISTNFCSQWYLTSNVILLKVIVFRKGGLAIQSVGFTKADTSRF